MAKFKLAGAAAALLLLVANSLPGWADSYAEGVALYAAGKYNLAATALESAVRKTPLDASSHYYLGLSYLALKQSTAARQQFTWVAQNASDPTIKSYAASAVNSLAGSARSGSTSSSGSPASSGSSGSSATARPTDFNSSASSSTSATANSVAPKKLGRCKILMFETSWCHYCHEFAPHFDETANKYRSSMDFQRLDAEEGGNVALKEKYGIHSYPRLVYLDGSGNVLYNEGRGAFDERVQELTTK